MGLSPSPTFANVYSNHEMYVLAHEDVEQVFGGPGVREVIQNGCEWESVSCRLWLLDSGVTKVNESISWLEKCLKKRSALEDSSTESIATRLAAAQQWTVGVMEVLVVFRLWNIGLRNA